MKTLRFFFCSVCVAVFLASPLFAQQVLKVNVTIGNDPMEFAYVMINGKSYASADALGNVSIPKSILHQGDTIAASVVGIQHSTIYNDVTASQVSIDLKDALLLPQGRLDSPRFSEKYFKEYINFPDIGQYFTQYQGDFDVVCPDKSVVSGKFVKHNVLKPDLAYLGNPEVVVSIRSGEHSDRVAELLAASSATAYESVAALFSYDLIIRYLGEHGGMRRFLVTRFSDAAGMKNLQILLSVDASTKEIVSAKSTWTSITGGVHAEIEAFYGYSKEFKKIFATDIRGKISYPLFPVDEGFVRYNVLMENITMERFAVK